MDMNFYLKPGAQTQLTDRVYEHAEKAKNYRIKSRSIKNLQEPLLSIHKTSKYISTLPIIEGYSSKKNDIESNNMLKDKIFRKRELDEILKDGYYPTCSDIGLIFRGLMIAQGHPTAYVETFHEDFLLNKGVKGHVFGRVYNSDGSSVIVDPQREPKIKEKESDIFPFIVFKEGLDSWDIGIASHEDILRLKYENIDNLMENYEKNRHHYKFIDMNTKIPK